METTLTKGKDNLVTISMTIPAAEATSAYNTAASKIAQYINVDGFRKGKVPLDFIKNFHSIDEYNIYKNSGLQINRVNGKYAYTQKIDWDFIGNIEDGKTNAQRVNEGLSPLDITGKPYEVHHVGQEADSPFAILTHSQHHDNYGVLHANTGTSESKIDRNIFEKEKDDFWIAFYEMTRAA